MWGLGFQRRKRSTEKELPWQIYASSMRQRIWILIPKPRSRSRFHQLLAMEAEVSYLNSLNSCLMLSSIAGLLRRWETMHEKAFRSACHCQSVIKASNHHHRHCYPLGNFFCQLGLACPIHLTFLSFPGFTSPRSQGSKHMHKDQGFFFEDTAPCPRAVLPEL